MTGSLEDIVKRIELKVPVDRAFAHFTKGMGEWWPLASHSLSGEAARTVVFEAHEGGRIFEIDGDGKEREWGCVLVCEVNARLVFSWVLEKPDLATEVEVRFAPLGESSTQVTLIHRGWDKRPDGATWRENYLQGWEPVLAQFAARVHAG